MNRFFKFACLTTALVLSSCVTRQDTIYLQDMFEMSLSNS